MHSLNLGLTLSKLKLIVQIKLPVRFIWTNHYIFQICNTFSVEIDFKSLKFVFEECKYGNFPSRNYPLFFNTL